MNLGNLLPSLSGVRKGGQGYVAMCPARDDHNASLSLAEANGRILLRGFRETADELTSELKWNINRLNPNNKSLPRFQTKLP